MKAKHPMRRVVFLIAFLWAVSIPNLQAAWSREFYLLMDSARFPTYRIEAIAVNDQGELFMGGLFSRIAGGLATNIARWDGHEWHGLGTGVNGQVRALACHGNSVYVGGSFTQAGGMGITNLARWDGTNWWPVGGSVTGSGGVNVLRFDGDNLYVGGTFTNAGGLPVQHIAKWDGQNWSDLGGGVTGPNAAVTGLLVEDNQIIVGGAFHSTAGIAATNIAIWNGDHWTNMGTGLKVPIYTMCRTAEGTLYACGGTNIAKWDGTGWTELLPPNSGSTVRPLRILFAETNQLYAGGLHLSGIAGAGDFIRLDGTNWTKIRTSFRSLQVGPVRHQGKSYFAGYLDNVMTSTLGLGTLEEGEWSTIGSGIQLGGSIPITIRALCLFRDEIVAGGHFNNETSSSGADLVASWNGKIWKKLGGGVEINSGQNRIEALTSNAEFLYAAMNPYLLGPTMNRWDGTNWVSWAAPSGDTWALALYGDLLLAGGTYGLECWNGTNWAVFQGGLSGTVNAIAVRNNEVFVGGDFTNAVTGAKHIIRWNGVEWSAFPGELDGAVNAFAFHGDELIVGGAFTNAGELTVNCIASWNGVTWTNIGRGFSEGRPKDNYQKPVPTSVNALAVSSQGVIYAGGNFEKAEGAAANYIAYWDGAGWQPMGSGFNIIPYEIVLKGDVLYVGGDFTTAGGFPSTRFAEWNTQDTAPRLKVWKHEEMHVLSWPTNITDFSLETTVSLSPAEPWTVVPTIVIGGSNTATNASGDDKRYYRLKRE